ncbi:MAG: hypothetical protein ACTSXO_00590 [Candidatus Heimdallarchaeota archaeon]
MFKEEFFDKDQMIDWRKKACEEIKTLRFCPNCNQLVLLKLQEHKHYQNIYSCTKCGEPILKTGTVRLPRGEGKGYGEKYSLRFKPRR